MNLLLSVIVAILVLQYLFDTLLGYLNARRFADAVPEELGDVFDKAGYAKSQAYKKANYVLGLVSTTFSLIATLAFLLFGGFGWVDNLVRSFTDNSILTALLFFGLLFMAIDILGTPFAYYQNFVIEERFGFNKSGKKLFFIDKIKGWGLMALIGGAILALVIQCFEWAGIHFWMYAWGLITVFSVFMNLFYSRLIVPLFNSQKALGAGSLKDKIEAYAQKAGFGLKHIYVIDGSKRSSKANAYFSGFGKEKRVTLYDTLINDLEEEEIVAVLAHEVGHYKRHHIVYNLIASISMTGLMLFVLSQFLKNPEFSLAISVAQPSFHATLIGFALLYSPISAFTGLLMNLLSRKFEYQADDFAKTTYAAQPLISALKKLSKHNLGNLTPHPAYVFVNYSHPPLIDRIRNLTST